MNPSRLFDERGSAVAISKELGRGGEGVVFDIAGQPDIVAKVYLKPPSNQHAAKLSAMAGMASASLLRVAAWPTGTLHDTSGAIAGFTMPKVGGHKPIFQLYLPKPRLQAFPKADWRFLIHAATNTARAFATVHSTGLVIGDVNHGNLVVADDATVQMIDCDSFQVSSHGQTWFCAVGVGTHQPPEMQGRDSYAGIVRTPNHDNFGLAVIIFQLLCMARHPFAGRFQGAGEPPSIEEAIAASRYAYSRDRSRTKMDVPPGSLPIDALPPEIQELFENAFAPGASRGGRPGADKWISALGSLAANVKPCRANGSHYYWKGANTCPWCAIEAASGITLFPVIFVPGAAGTGGMAALWQEVGKVADPPPLIPWPPVPTPSATPSPDALATASSGKGLRLAAWASIASAVAIALFVASPGARAVLVPAIGVLTFLIFKHTQKQHPGPFRQRLVDVKQDWNALRSSWATPVTGQDLPELRTGLSRLKAEYDSLPNERAKRLQRLHEQRRDKQLEEHLDQFSLAGAKISGIGPTRVATLSSHGIDTAGDIVSARILAVSGFGPTTVNKLLVWRRGHESSFRFDPNRGVSPSDVAVVERDIAAHRMKLEREVATALARLKAVSSATATRRQALHGKLAELMPRYSQALADVAVVPEGRQTHLRLLTISGLAIVLSVFSALNATSRSPTSRIPAATLLALPQAAVLTALPVPSSGPLGATHMVAPTGMSPYEPERQTETSPSAGQQATVVKPLTSPGAVSAPRLDVGMVTVKQAANVRTAANNAAPIVRMAPQGAILKVFAKSAGWVQVGEDEPWGWVFSGLVEAKQ